MESGRRVAAADFEEGSVEIAGALLQPAATRSGVAPQGCCRMVTTRSAATSRRTVFHPTASER